MNLKRFTLDLLDLLVEVFISRRDFIRIILDFEIKFDNDNFAEDKSKVKRLQRSQCRPKFHL